METQPISKTKVAAAVAAAAITATAVLGPEGAFGDSSKSQPQPEVTSDKKQESIYMQEDAAQTLIDKDRATGETAIYVVKSGDTPSEIAEDLGSSKVEDQIIAQNDDSAIIRPGQRYAFPVAELDPNSVTLTTENAPTQLGIGADGELAPHGPEEPMQFVAEKADVASQGPG